MALYNYINRIERMDTLIRRKSTGTPKELAEKLNISERWLYIFLDELRTELNCPIRYDRRKRSYVYEIPGRVLIKFKSEIETEELKKVSGGKNFKNYFSLYL
jgi:predicted DNA-binding transcriptional regulator YafY